MSDTQSTENTEPSTAGIPMPNAITVSDNAAKRIAQLIEMEAKDGMRLRVSVSGGGCSGFQYGFSLDDEKNDDDLLFEKNDIEKGALAKQ